MTRRLDRNAWWFVAAFAVHNLEEAIWLPEWSRSPGGWRTPVEDVRFRVAVTALTLTAVVLTHLATSRGGRATQLLVGMWAAMVGNAVVPHAAVAIALGAVVPGLTTAMLVVVPVSAWLIRDVIRTGLMSGRAVVAWGLVVAATMAGAVTIALSSG